MNKLKFTTVDMDETEHDTEYWLSFSDLMAGLLMIFALMLLSALYDYTSGVEGIREIVKVREEVIDSLKAEFPEGRGAVVHVEENGSVRFLDNVLFSQGSAVVSPEGRTQLSSFATSYLSVLLGNPKFREQLRAVVVEGHTNSDGSYEVNLNLSQVRAFAVMLVLLEHAGEYRNILEALVSANGRSYSDLLYLEDDLTIEDKERSRRIEIHFRLNDDELLRQILDQVAGVRAAP